MKMLVNADFFLSVVGKRFICAQIIPLIRSCLEVAGDSSETRTLEMLQSVRNLVTENANISSKLLLHVGIVEWLTTSLLD
jgi:hypothetical protein